MNEQSKHEVRESVREEYGAIARGTSATCMPGCCGPSADPTSRTEASRRLGYTPEDLASVPEGANLGLGCGNPMAIARLNLGETVLDLGSGGGFDCFLAAKQVGPGGQVIGVDMTADMVSRARANAAKLHTTNVEFRLGEIEHLPVADGTIDVILSNCVINLSPDKAGVFREALRALAPGGRLAISDIIATAPLPEHIASDPRAHNSCLAGATTLDQMRAMLTEVGFVDVNVQIRQESREAIAAWAPGSGIENYVASATIEATKAAAPCCEKTCCPPEASV